MSESQKKRKTDWIYIIQPDGQKRIASPSYVRQLLKICALEKELRHEIWKLNVRIKELEAPIQKKKVLEFMEDKGFHTADWIQRRLPGIPGRIIWDLFAEGKLEKKRSGAHNMYGVKH